MSSGASRRSHKLVNGHFQPNLLPIGLRGLPIIGITSIPRLVSHDGNALLA